MERHDEERQADDEREVEDTKDEAIAPAETLDRRRGSEAQYAYNRPRQTHCASRQGDIAAEAERRGDIAPRRRAIVGRVGPDAARHQIDQA